MRIERPLRFAYVGNVGNPASTESYVAQAILDVGHEVEGFQENDPGIWDDLAGRVDEFDVFLWTRTPWDPPIPHEPQHRLLEAARAARVPSVGLHLDRWFGLGREEAVHTEPFFRVDLLCTADGGHQDEFAAAGVNHRWTPPGVSGRHAAPAGKIDRELVKDVVFVGRWRGYHPEWQWRQDLVAFLQRNYRNRVAFWEGTLPDARLSDLYVSAKVTVGDSCLAGGATRYWSNRIPETLARGGLLIHPYVEGIEEHYTPGEHLLTFPLGDFAALKALIDHHRRRPGEGDAMRAAARAHTLANHTFEVRVGQIIEALYEQELLGVEAPRMPIENVRVAGTWGPVREWCDFEAVDYELREGSADGDALDEVWIENVYHGTREEVAGKLVVDVGAHVGAFALWAAAAGASVVAYEPHKANRAQLEANLAANPTLVDLVRVEAMAVAGESGTGAMSKTEKGRETDSVLIAGKTVKVISLSDVILDAVCNSSHNEVALLKVDAEWSEYEMALTIGESLRLVRRAAFEFHGPWNTDVEHRQLDDHHAGRFGNLVARLAEYGHVEVLGRPSVGGYLYWERYE